MCWRSQNGPTLKEAFDGGPDVACRFQEIQMSRVSVAYLCPCHMSNSRNGPVACQIPEMALSQVNKLKVACQFKKWPFLPVDFRGLVPYL